jgi:hypothetical protein
MEQSPHVNNVNSVDNQNLIIQYQNINGLSPVKLQQLYQICINSTNKIICLAETWFTISHQSAKSSNLFVCESLPSATRSTGHQNGGLLILSHPSLRANISVIQRSESSVSITVSGRTISFVYYPPSLPPTVLQSSLQSLAASDIVMGDINTQFGSRFYSLNSGPRNRLEIIQSWCSEHSFDHPTPSSGRTKLDHVFSKPGCLLSFDALPGLVYSDHPVALTIKPAASVPEGRIDDPVRYLLRNLDKEPIRLYLRESYNVLSSGLDSLGSEGIVNVNDLDHILMDIVQTCAAESLGVYRPSVVRSRPDHELKKLQLASSHAEAVRLFKRGCRLNTTRIESRSQDKSPLVDAFEFFQNIYMQDNDDLRMEEPLVLDCGTDFRFTDEEVQRVIEKYPTYKSCGEDGIHVKIMSGLIGSNFVHHLTSLFNHCLSQGVTPDRWNTSRCNPIPKIPHAKFIVDFRPISLTVMFRRCFEILLLHRLERQIQDKFDIGQAGFRKGFSVPSQIAISHDRSRERFIHRVFIDLKQAYDRTPIKIVLQLLQERGIESGLISLIQSLFFNCRTRVNVNGSLTDYIVLERGLMQGSILSPILFSLFIDPLARSINDSFPVTEYPALLFADDIQIVHGSPVVIQEALDKVSVWCHQNGMEINLKKCGTTSENYAFYLNEAKVDFTATYKYLGIPTASTGINWTKLRDERIGNGRKVLNFCMKFEHVWAIGTKLAVFKAFIRPSVEYGGVLLSKYFNHSPEKDIILKPYEDFLTASVNWISGISSHFHSNVCMVLGIPLMKNRFAHLGAGLSRSLILSSQNNAIRAVKDWFSQRFWMKSLSVACWNDALWNDYKRQVLSLTVDEQISLSRFIKKQALLELEQRAPVLSQKIPRSSRLSSGLGADGFVAVPLKKLQKFCMKWRSNAFCHLKKCVCGERFTRGHYERCLSEFIELDIDTAITLRRWDLVEDQMIQLQLLPKST